MTPIDAHLCASTRQSDHGEFRSASYHFAWAVALAPLLACMTSGEPTAQSEDALSADQALAQRLPDFYATERVFARDGIAVVRTPAGGIFLRARTCAERDEVLGALEKLRQRTDPGFRLGDVSPKSLPTGWCEARLDRVLSPYLAQSVGKVIDDTSVQSNCWGHSAAVAGTVTGVKELSAAGFTHMLGSPLCRKLPGSEAPAPGDVVVLRSVAEKNGTFAFEEVHTAVWITKNVWSSKNGAGSFVIASARSILAEYFGPSTPAECRERSPDRPQADYLRRCQSVLEVYRCESIEQYRRRVRGAYAAYDAKLLALQPWLWETIHQQQGQEAGGDAVVPKGHAYVSRHPFDPVSATYQRVPSAVKNRLDAMARDPCFATQYDLSLPAVPPLPFVYDSNGDGYARLEAGYHRAEEGMADLLGATLSREERPLVELLFLEVASSQLSTLSQSNAPRALQLLSPDRAVRVNP